MELQKAYSPELAEIINGFFRQWKYPVMVIYGNPDTGKTDSGLLFAEIGKDSGLIDYLASNINTYGYGALITNLEDLDYWFKNQTGKKCFILDEAGIHDDSRSPLSLMQRKIRHEVFIARKYLAKWIFILQELEDIDKWKHSELTGMIVKKKKVGNEFNALVKAKWMDDLILIRDIPKTSIPFNTLDIAPFYLERQIDDAEVDLRGLPFQVAYLYAKHGNLARVIEDLKQKTGIEYKHMQVKRLLIKYLREQLRIEVKRGRPPKEKKENGEKK